VPVVPSSPGAVQVSVTLAAEPDTVSLAARSEMAAGATGGVLAAASFDSAPALPASSTARIMKW
jgi:hypothetical protein